MAASVSDNGPAAGATFTLSATVSNDGDEASAGHDVALLPVGGCNYHDLRHGVRHGPRGGACRFGNQQSVLGRVRAVDSWNVLLRRLRGRSGGASPTRPTTARYPYGWKW